MASSLKNIIKLFSQTRSVFGIRVLGTENVEKERFNHAANVLRQYLDNNQDGKPDSKKLVRKLKRNKAAMTLFENENELDGFLDSHEHKIDNARINFQDLYNDEIILASDNTTQFDATLEEVFHLISDYGYAQINPKTFGSSKDSIIGQLMTEARGGHFRTTPSKYPKKAYYTYNDKTCNYECQITEYLYWGVTSMLGGQNGPGRYNDIKEEWRLNTPEKIKSHAPELYDLLSDPKLGLPTILPDGIL